MCAAHSLLTSYNMPVVLLTVTIVPYVVWLVIVHDDNDVPYNIAQHTAMIIDCVLLMILYSI